jgi:SlyX protein
MTDISIDERLERLESRLMLTEDLMDVLNTTIYRQHRMIDDLQTAVRELAGRLRAVQGAQSDAPLRPEDEIPPHW